MKERKKETKKEIKYKKIKKENEREKQRKKDMMIHCKALGDKTSAATRVYARLTMDPVRDSIQRGADKMLEFVNGGEN